MGNSHSTTTSRHEVPPGDSFNRSFHDQIKVDLSHKRENNSTVPLALKGLPTDWRHGTKEWASRGLPKSMLKNWFKKDLMAHSEN